MDQNQLDAALAQQSSGPGIVPMVFAVAIGALMIASMWRIFAKAGQPGWAALIPIYNLITLAKVAGKDGWMGLLLYVPVVNVVMFIIFSLAIAKNFGKGAGFGVGLLLLGPVFYPILAFSDSQYQPAQ